jgi:hypothetical protein
VSIPRARIVAVAVMFALLGVFAPAANAQNYNQTPLMNVSGFTTVENAGQTWDGTWTFTDPSHRTMSGAWVNRQTGQRVYAQQMSVHQEGDRLIISRPGVGNYVGMLSPDGRSINGTMSWVAGNFVARASGGNDRPAAPAYGAPIMSAPGWVTVERAGQTWDGTWTFTDRDHRTMSATWVNRETGQRVSAQRMFVRQNGQQIVISRPGTGDYVGTLSQDGRSIRGTMSWISGSFTAHV